MMNNIIKIIFFLLIFPFGYVHAQLDSTVVMFDMNNARHSLNIKEIWSKEECALSIKNSKDTLKLNGVFEVTDKKLLLNKFLKLEFRIRGGTGVHLRVTKLFAIKQNKIYEVLSLLTSYQYKSSVKSENEKYSVKFRLLQNGAFRLTLDETANNMDGSKQQWLKHFTLRFDSVHMVFYNQIKNQTGIKVCDSMLTKPTLYMIELKNEKYVNIENKWFQLIEGCYRPF